MYSYPGIQKEKNMDKVKEKRDQVFSINITKSVMNKINYICNSKNISKPDLITSYVMSKNDDSNNAEIIDSIQWESGLIQKEITKSTGILNTLIQKVLVRIENTLNKSFQNSEDKIIQRMNEIEKERIDREPIWLFQKATEIQINETNKKNISLYKRGDIIKSKSGNLITIHSIDVQKDKMKILVLPITETTSLIDFDFNDVNAVNNIAQLFRQ